MANATARKAQKAEKADTDNGQESNEMTTATDTAPYDISAIDDLGSDFKFRRVGAGKQRVAGPFEDAVENFVGRGAKILPVPDEETGHQAVKDLHHARNREDRNYGMESRVIQLKEDDKDSGLKAGWYVQFEIKPEKRKLVRKSAKSDSNGSTEPADELVTD